MRIVFLSKDSALMEYVLSMVKDRFSDGLSWQPEKKENSLLGPPFLNRGPPPSLEVFVREDAKTHYLEPVPKNLILGRG